MLTLFCKQNRQISLPKSGHTLDAILNDWLDHTRAKVKRSTFATYLGVADRYVRPTLGALTTDELTNAELEKFLESAARTYSSATVRVICHVLRAVLEYASAQGYATPAGHGFAAPKSEYREARTLSSEEQLRLLDWLRSRESPAEFGILLCLATGMRLGEACGLRWDDIPEGRYIIYKENAAAPPGAGWFRQDCPSVRAAQERQLGARDTRPRLASGPAGRAAP